MKIGLVFVNAGPFSEPDLFRTLALSAEDNGFESLWTVEHVAIPDGFQSSYPYTASGKLGNMDEFLLSDPLVHLAFAASITKRIRFGTAVMFGPLRSHPKPVQAGGVPIVVGGHSPAAVRRAARLGDGFFPAVGKLNGLNWEVDAAAPERLRALIEALKTECATIGRDFSTMEVSCIGPAHVDTINKLREMGMSRVVLGPPAFEPTSLRSRLEKIGREVIARLP